MVAARRRVTFSLRVMLPVPEKVELESVETRLEELAPSGRIAASSRCGMPKSCGIPAVVEDFRVRPEVSLRVA